MSDTNPLYGRELLAPPEVYDDSGSAEVLRAWIVKGACR
jgi:hypothetical protein